MLPQKRVLHDHDLVACAADMSYNTELKCQPHRSVKNNRTPAQVYASDLSFSMIQHIVKSKNKVRNNGIGNSNLPFTST